MKFCTLASGSQGNSIFFEHLSTRILVDVGITGKELERRLATIGLSPRDLDGICITHEHDDHVRSLAVLSKRFGLPVYMTAKTFDAYKDRERIAPHVTVFEGGATFSIGNLTLTSFPIPHDAADPHGFIVQSNGKRVAVATDMGYITNLIRHRLRDLDWLILESNHDELMLKQGPYPWFLKQRVLGKQGHLSNMSAAAGILDAHHENLKGVSLAHLSKTNNTPELALATVQHQLQRWGINHLKISVSLQDIVSSVIEL